MLPFPSRVVYSLNEPFSFGKCVATDQISCVVNFLPAELTTTTWGCHSALLAVLLCRLRPVSAPAVGLPLQHPFRQ